MKVKLTNFEIERYINIISSPESFRNNVGVKIPAEMDWALRINIKTLSDRFMLFNEAREELGDEFVDAGKVDGDHVKEEFVPEYNKRMSILYSQMNELELTALNREDIKYIRNLSMPERDFLDLMTEEDSETED